MSARDVATAINELSYNEMMSIAKCMFDMLTDEDGNIWPNFPQDENQIALFLSSWAEAVEE